ncbi:MULTISPECIES: glycosyltransferase family 39 protein [unclassified Bradyrhizobium]|uniref:glycosyltransferase family 39 protein n=1 Tax=unclassified Bradyrhizobium TaxID=2631580 RepID=UPI0028EA9AF8|nr:MULTISPECIES: glycosyltransferase family 39 protein [unclassified Bradyrhizobium]
MFHGFAFSTVAERSDCHPAAWRRPFLRWLDGIEAGWAVPLLLVCFVAVWTAYLSIAYAGAGLHPDVIETWTFGRQFAWGYDKHPPLMGWIAGAWTAVFPLSDWSFHLMAMTNAALALWFVDLISRRFVVGDKRVIVLLLLMLTPAYQFHAQRFNANSVQLATWPLATYCFLRAFETRTLPWAAAAGLTAALALLGKYYSIFLVVSFAFAAMAHPQRRAYFTSASPWISTAAGLAALSMHLDWLVGHDAAPIQHALMHARSTLATSSRDALFFVLGLAAAMAVPAATWLIVAGARIRSFTTEMAALNGGLRLLSYIAIGTVGLPVINALIMGTDLPSLWALQGLFLFVVVIVCGASYPIARFHTVNIAVLTVGIAVLAAIVAAPLHAFYRNRHGYEEGRTFYQQTAREATRQWRELTGKPLEHVGGTESLALATAFYSADHPAYGLPVSIHETGADSGSEGWISLCFRDQADCIGAAEAVAARSGTYVKREFAVQARLLGWTGCTRTVVAFLVTRRKEP